MKTRFSAISEVGPAETRAKLEELLTHEGVEFESGESFVRSVSTPFVVLNTQKILYSKRKWTRLNPFVCVTGVSFAIEDEAHTKPRVSIEIDQTRGYFYATIWRILGLYMAVVVPPLGAKVATSLLAFLISMAVIFLFGRYLI
jgi:hypothetical protein